MLIAFDATPIAAMLFFSSSSRIRLGGADGISVLVLFSAIGEVKIMRHVRNGSFAIF